MMPRMWDCLYLESVDSTQTAALNRIQAAQGRLAPFALWTANQTAGYGRHGRAWLASGQALAVSVAWPQTGPLAHLAPWPLRVSLAVVEALSQRWPQLDSPLSVKWPNDIMANGQKIAGVLVGLHRCDGHAWLIAGIGLNLGGEQVLPKDICAGSLKALGLADADAPSLASMLCAAVAAESMGAGDGLAARFDQRNLYANHEVELRNAQDGTTLMSGTVCGISPTGAIRLKQQDGTERTAEIGEISLRIREAC